MSRLRKTFCNDVGLFSMLSETADLMPEVTSFASAITMAEVYRYLTIPRGIVRSSAGLQLDSSLTSASILAHEKAAISI
jgi:hypothetical protein